MPDEPDATETTSQPASEKESHPQTRLERLRSAAADARERLEEKRETSTTVAVAFDAFGHDVEAGGPVLAAALGFRVFLFFVPYICFFVIVFGFVADVTHRDATNLFRGRGIAGLTASGITTGRDLSTGARISALVLVTYALFVSARSFIKVLRIVHMLVWRVAPTRMRNATRATLVFIAIVTVALVFSALIDALRARLAIGGIVALALYTFVPFALWWVVSWWLPHGETDMLGLAPGAAVFAIGAEVLQVLTVVWFPHYLQSKSDVYGAIGIAIVLLLWAYLLGRMIAIAAALNVAIWRRRRGATPDLPAFATRLPLVGDRIGRLWARLVGGSGSPPPDDASS
ncbi:MAG TPA: YhjD/YihY/BrkB family envelope integrity protein [Acidimicrobiia bacterium]|nr:YhjD/YihY/BrkB family envelope integrity protein [Acidimicrobiia bacterium]